MAAQFKKGVYDSVMNDGKKYRLAIFDLDGTILDTLDDLADSLNVVLEKNGYPTHTIDAVRRFVGNGIAKLIHRALPKEASEEEFEQVFAQFKVYYKAHCADKTKPYAKIPELLASLKESGMLLAVVSNKGDFAVQDLMVQYFPGMFDMAMGEREGIARKPAPDMVYEVLKELHVEREDAVYIGDSEVDVQTAANAEMDALIVGWGFREETYLLEQGAKRVVASVEELKLALLEN